jgi:hypothetical protein
MISTSGSKRTSPGVAVPYLSAGTTIQPMVACYSTRNTTRQQHAEQHTGATTNPGVHMQDDSSRYACCRTAVLRTYSHASCQHNTSATLPHHRPPSKQILLSLTTHRGMATHPRRPPQVQGCRWSQVQERSWSRLQETGKGSLSAVSTPAARSQGLGRTPLWGLARTHQGLGRTLLWGLARTPQWAPGRTHL